jgi:hypothetical protein
MNVKSQKTYLVSRLVSLIVVSFTVAGAAIAAESDVAVSARNEIASITASNLPTRGSLEASGFKSANDAVEAFAKAYAAKGDAESVEYNAGIVKSADGTFGYATPISGALSATTVNVSGYHRSLRDQFGGDYVALAHTSLDNAARFSPIDVNDATIMPIYQVLSSGQTWRLDNTIVRNRLRGETTQGPGPLRIYLQRHEGMSGECVSACG